MTRTLRSGVPLATYRLQLHRGFDFDAARSVVPYLAALGVTHCYLSPIFTAAPGSLHGYDVCRHSEINPELGGEAGFDALVEEVAGHGMGLILDFVPNHMSNDLDTNNWWRDVLENGPSSQFARFFDIDWAPTKLELKDRILLPILGEPYGDALERGALSLRYQNGGLVVVYGDYSLPINPRRSPLVFEDGLADLEAALGPESPDLREFLSVLTALRNLPPYTERDRPQIVERRREKTVARERLAKLVTSCAAVRDHIGRALETFNGVPGRPHTFDRLHELLEQQAYRLASWRTASDEINYRRFFDINALAGLRVEDPIVFSTIHNLLLRLIGAGNATGVRLDHIDGLYDPAAYLEQLNAAIDQALGERRTDASDRQPLQPPYVVVEKILSESEHLRDDWKVAGTTGYGFMNDVNGVFVDRRHGKRLQRLYAKISGRHDPFADVAYESKQLIVSTALSSEFQVLAQAINRFSETDRRFRDFTLVTIRRALRELVASFPVYRTYVAAAGATALDTAVLDDAIRLARLRNPAMESSTFDFLRLVLLPRGSGTKGDGERDSTQSQTAIAMRFQQYTAPVQAKGVEDTAFYRYHALISLNEVGGDPARIGRTVAAFHSANQERLAHWPGEMLATTTHDTKRSEDARARITVISEIPDEWQTVVSQWRRINTPNRTRIAGTQAPDQNDEYLFYQALVGTWPMEGLSTPLAESGRAELVGRMSAYMHKAIKEAKLHTSWITPNLSYETAVRQFVERTLVGATAPDFLASFIPFVQHVAVAGAANSLAQLVLKVTSPGVPDVYQGTELWDLSLVDPDNRRPVDWSKRRTLLETLDSRLAKIETTDGGDAAPPIDLLESWTDGRIKMFVTALVLRWRRTHPRLFTDGEYIPLVADGSCANHVIAFARRTTRCSLVVVVPRLTMSLRATHDWPVGEGVWGDTAIALPESPGASELHDLISGTRLHPELAHGASVVYLRDALATLPVALLWAEHLRRA